MIQIMNISGGGHMRMTEAVTDAHTIDSVIEKQSRLHMQECIKVNMGQTATLAEALRPVTDIFGKHECAVLSP